MIINASTLYFRITTLLLFIQIMQISKLYLKFTTNSEKQKILFLNSMFEQN